MHDELLRIVFIVGTMGLSFLTYVVLRVGCVFVFPHSVRSVSPRRTLFIALVLALVQGVLYCASFLIASDFWENRFLHAVAGGAFGVLLVHTALREARVILTKMQYVAIVVPVVSFFGVGYEIAEFLATIIFGFEFQFTRYDTWYDLVSNTVGIMGATLVGLLVYYPHRCICHER